MGLFVLADCWVHIPVIPCVLFTPFRQSVEHEEIVVFRGIINTADPWDRGEELIFL